MSAPDFVSLEGIDKTGKTLIFEILKTEYPNAHFVSDPTQINPWGDIFVNGPDLEQIGNIEVGEMAGLVNSFLFLSARLDCFQREIQPTLEDGTSVVSDRFSDSWLAYQPVFEERYFDDFEKAIQFFDEIHNFCVEHEVLRNPDLTVLITLDEDTLRKRIEETDEPSGYEKPDKLMKVQDVYFYLKQEYSDRIEHIEDSGQGIIEVYHEVERRLDNNGMLE